MSRVPHIEKDKRRLRLLQTRYGTLKATLIKIGFICPGSVAKRYMPCGNRSCGCAAGPHAHHGPYYEWTRKVRGKTVSVRLTAEQARLYQEWIQNDRRLKKILTRMRALSLRLIKHQKPAAPRR